MSRHGKVARLPRSIREELNHRLTNGESGPTLVAWLNGLPETHQVLTAHFDGRPINAQNLSDWRRGGFEDWLRRDEARDWVARTVEESDDLIADSGAVPLAERVAVPVLIALRATLSQALVAADPVEKRKAVFGVARHLSQLQRVSHANDRLHFQQKCRDWKDQQAAGELDTITCAVGDPLPPPIKVNQAKSR